MRLTAEEFFAAPRKKITLIGMSGVGKTHISAWLEQDGWRNFSCDLVIAEKYLALLLKGGATRDDIRSVSSFIGQLGMPERGGLPLNEFLRRQRLYNEAECAALREATALADAPGEDNIVIDSTGSFCEITDRAIIDAVGRRSLIVYLQTDPDDLDTIIGRAQSYPKPLYFPPATFDDWLQTYMIEHAIESESQIVPNEFSRWVFPLLIQERLPKYHALADEYGVIIPAHRMKEVASAADFLTVLTDELAQQGEVA